MNAANSILRAGLLIGLLCLAGSLERIAAQEGASTDENELQEKSASVGPAPAEIQLRPDLAVRNEPQITRVEAFAGRPLGIGSISFRLRRGDEMIIRTGSEMIREKDNRILYPVLTKSPVLKFFENFSGTRPTQPDNVHTILFLFKGDAPLEVSIYGSAVTTKTVNVKLARDRQFDRSLEKWWRLFNESANRQQDWGDYPGLVETYLTSMLSRRLDLPLSEPSEGGSDPLGETFELMFDVESIRMDAIRKAMSGLADIQPANLPLPASIQWQPKTVQGVPVDVEIEPIAEFVPEECFYLRFGTWQNQIWLKRLMEEYGGDLGRMISLRGYKPVVASKFLDQLAIRSTELDALFGGNLIADVAVIGTDTYFGDGSSVGVMLLARKTEQLKNNLLGKRQRFAEQQQSRGVEIRDLEFGGTTIQALTTPDNRYRSFYVTIGDCHLTTSSLRMAQRFVEAAGGIRSLAQNAEFRYARWHMPLQREDTVFVYFSTPFFRSLLEPACQIELRRRNRIVADMQLNEIAHLAARAEGVFPVNVDNLVQFGFLPKGFNQRPDQSQFQSGVEGWSDSIRGLRGFFTPIADMQISAVSSEEVEWFRDRSRYFVENEPMIQPLMFGIKRYQSEREQNVERVVFDLHVPPFGLEKYDWLISMMGPPLNQRIKPLPNEIVSFQASMAGNGSGSGKVEPHLLFVGIQDEVDFEVDLQPTSTLKLYDAIRTSPGYMGAYPKPGYLDWMRNLGGRPDEEGFTYSRLFKLWRLQSDGFSLLAFDQERLRRIKPHLEVVPAERPAQVRISIGDLKASGLNNWASSINFRRAWQTSIANVQLLNLLIEQFGVEPAEAKEIAERMLNVRLVCSLGGEYQLAETRGGRALWHSTAWPSFSAPELPADYQAPVLQWFRGSEVEISQVGNQYFVHGILDIERKNDTSTLPPFRLFQGFGSLFSGASNGDGANEREKK